jgi:plasmid maintenance system antidote protein VapI
MNLTLKAEIVRRYGSQANFAQAMKTHEPIISQVIHGRRNLEPEEQERWAQALGERPEELFKD